MKSTDPKITLAYSKLIGTPYSKKDCWGIVVEFYRQVFNIELQNYYTEVPDNRDIAKKLIYSSMKDFDEVSDRNFGDIILIRLYGVESHIAVYLGNGFILHTTDHSGCVMERITRWEKSIVGFYRAKNDST